MGCCPGTCSQELGDIPFGRELLKSKSKTFANSASDGGGDRALSSVDALTMDMDGEAGCGEGA